MTDTLRINAPDVKMVAHRGLSGLETENSASAFVAAGNRTYFGIETDVHRTVDGRYVLMHDSSTKRTAVDDMIIENTTFDTLRSLRLIDEGGQRCRGDLIMPTLEEYIRICKKYDKAAVLELKGAYTPAHIDEIIAIIREIGWLERTVFISFTLPNMICLRERLPQQPAQFLTGEFTDWLVDTLVKYNLDLDISFKHITAEQVKQVHDAGLKVNVWTVNTLEDAQRMLDYGVDYITTNILESRG